MNDLSVFSTGYLIVAIVTVSICVIFFILDIIMALNDVKNDRLNYIIHNESNNRAYFIPVLWGMIMGHLFFGKYFADSSKLPLGAERSIILLALVNIALIIIGQKFPLKTKHPSFIRIALLISGILYGHFFWSMNYIVK